MTPRTAVKRSPSSTDLTREAVSQISSALRELLADVFGLYVKTKNFHWHISGPHFRDYHLLLDEQAAVRADKLFAVPPQVEKVEVLASTPLKG